MNQSVPEGGCFHQVLMLHGPSAAPAGFLLPSQPRVTGDKFPALRALEGAELVWVPARWQLKRARLEKRGSRDVVSMFPGVSSWLAARVGNGGVNPAWVQGHAREEMNTRSHFFPWDIIKKKKIASCQVCKTAMLLGFGVFFVCLWGVFCGVFVWFFSY